MLVVPENSRQPLLHSAMTVLFPLLRVRRRTHCLPVCGLISVALQCDLNDSRHATTMSAQSQPYRGCFVITTPKCVNDLAEGREVRRCQQVRRDPTRRDVHLSSSIASGRGGTGRKVSHNLPLLPSGAANSKGFAPPARPSPRSSRLHIVFHSEN